MDVQDQAILEKLVCDEIPDTKKLQQIRLDSIGIESEDEKNVNIYHTAWADRARRLIKIPQEQLKLIYRISIPLTFDNIKINQDNSFNAFFTRWMAKNGSCGAMNLITSRGFDQLLDFFKDNNLPFRIELAYGKIFDEDEERNPAVSVPFSFHNCREYGGYHIHRQQYVICERKIIGIPYYIKTIEISHKSQQNESKYKTLELKEQVVKRTKYEAHAMFLSPGFEDKISPEKYLSRELKEKDKESVQNWNEKDNGRLIHLHNELIKIGMPIIIYDPAWISGGEK